MPPTPKPRERRVLRVAVLVDELVCDEIHQHEAGSISMGSDYRSDVVLFGSRAPRQHTLFDYRQGAYYLDLPEHARGKVSMGRKSFSVSGLRKRFGGADGKLRVKLSPRAKGKLLIGESTVLFQFAHPKKLPPRLPFPVQFSARVEQMWGRRELSTLTASALGLGSYFTWAATAEVDRNDDFEIDERFVKAMGLNVEDEKEPEVEEEEEDALAEEDEEKQEIKDKPKPEPKKLDKPPEKYSKQAMKQARNVGIARVLGTYGGPGEGTVLDIIDSTENNLGDLFAQGMTTTMLADGGAITPFVPGGEGISLGGSMAQTEGFELGEGPELAKDDKRERKIKARTKTTKTDVFGDVDAKGVKAQINRRTNALRYCYETVLRTRPDLAGKMTYTISISKMGSVTAVAIEEDTVGDSKVKACTTAKIKGWRFGTQEDSGEVTFTVVFSGG